MAPRSSFPTVFSCVLALLCLLPAVAPADNAAPGVGPTAVWRVQAKGDGATVYLAGSIHLLRESDHPLPPAFEMAFAASRELVVEVAGVEMEAIQQETMKRGMYGDAGTIRDDLSPETYRDLRNYLEGVGLRADALDGFRPWMASSTISMTELLKLGGQFEFGVDNYFEQKAIERGLPVTGLETAAFQIGLFAGLGKEDQEAMLRATLEDMESIDTGFPEMIRSWREGDDAALDKIMNDSLGTLPDLRAAVLDKRNAAWAKKIEKMLAGERTAMVLVGAGHLVGEAGLVNLLKERGYRVQRFGVVEQAAEKPPRFIEL